MSKSKKCPFCKHKMVRLFPTFTRDDYNVEKWYCVNCGFTAEFIKVKEV